MKPKMTRNEMNGIAHGSFNDTVIPFLLKVYDIAVIQLIFEVIFILIESMCGCLLLAQSSNVELHLARVSKVCITTYYKVFF